MASKMAPVPSRMISESDGGPAGAGDASAGAAAANVRTEAIAAVAMVMPCNKLRIEDPQSA
jgi:hypothetical protein